MRNNLYKFTLNSVNGAGMPWYSELQDPIDDAAGYFGISVSVGEWTLRDTGFGI